MLINLLSRKDHAHRVPVEKKKGKTQSVSQARQSICFKVAVFELAAIETLRVRGELEAYQQLLSKYDSLVRLATG
jgi:hypothetical protein